MATQVQFRGGTTSEHSSFNGVAKEVTVDTTKQTLVVQDGSTNGGFPLLREKNPDEQGLFFGTGNDLQLYHSSGHSYITNSTGNLRIDTNELRLRSKTDVESFIVADHNGAVQLFYDGAQKLATTSGGIDVAGSVTADDIITAGALLHEGDSDTLVHFSAADTIDIKTGSVIRLTVNNSGLNLGSNLYSAGNNISLGDSSGTADDRLQIGDSQDLQLFHVGGGHSYVINKSNNLYIQTPNYVEIGSTETDGSSEETSAKFIRNGSVELYYNSVKKFETLSTGAKVTGGLELTGSLKLSDINSPNDENVHINSVDDALTVGAFGTNGAFKVKTGASNTLALTVDSSQDATFAGNVGIGSSPDTLLHLAGADTAIIRLENTDTSLVADQIIGGLEFEKQDPSGAGVGVVGGVRMYSGDSIGSTAYLTLSTSNSTTNNQQVLKLDSDKVAHFAGDVKVLTGDVMMGNGRGISFTATGDASGMTSELLDDYEEGSWTPNFKLGGAQVGMTHDAPQGRYTKIGRTVYASFVVGITAKGSSTGSLVLSGLPFTVADDSGDRCNGLVSYYQNMANIDSTLTLYNTGNSNQANFYEMGTATMTALSDAHVTNTSLMRGFVKYHSAS